MDRLKIKRKSLVIIEPFEKNLLQNFSELKLNRHLSRSENDVSKSVETPIRANVVRRKSVVVTEPLLERFITFGLDEFNDKIQKEKTYAEFYLKNKKNNSIALNDDSFTNEQKLELDYVFKLFDSDKDGLLNESWNFS